MIHVTCLCSFLGVFHPVQKAGKAVGKPPAIQKQLQIPLAVTLVDKPSTTVAVTAAATT